MRWHRYAPATSHRPLYLEELEQLLVLSTFQLHPLFSDHAVLQRNQPAAVWGTGQAGDTIDVTFHDQNQETIVSSDGNWKVYLSAMPADASGQDLRAADTTQNIELTRSDVVVGDVWLLAGQSNMGPNPPAPAGIDDPTLRFAQFSDSGPGTENPVSTYQTLPSSAVRWQSVNAADSGTLAATAYYFGREMQRQQNVPVGLIVTAVGASPIEAWISRASLGTQPWFGGPTDPATTSASSSLYFRPYVRYNDLIHPTAPFTISGFVWYQGETDAVWSQADRYRQLLPLLIHDWRALWGANLPFVIVQLPNVQMPGDFAGIRDAQLATLAVPNTGLAVTIDIGDGGMHVANKQPIGERAALVAAELAYGSSHESTGPIYQSARVDGNVIRVFFDHVGDGLIASDGQPLRWFQIAGADGRFVPALAVIDGNSVVVSNPFVPHPFLVRYAWANDPTGLNFANADGLPASPFRATATIIPVRVPIVSQPVLVPASAALPPAILPAPLARRRAAPRVVNYADLAPALGLVQTPALTNVEVPPHVITNDFAPTPPVLDAFFGPSNSAAGNASVSSRDTSSDPLVYEANADRKRVDFLFSEYAVTGA